MASSTTISIDRFRRRRQATGSAPAATSGSSLVGASLGTVERRYGLMSSSESVVVSCELATSGDLAVADRLAFLASIERREAVVVVEHEGWYVACATERPIGAAELHELRPPEGGSPRVMSLVTERGITPALGPLVA